MPYFGRLANEPGFDIDFRAPVLGPKISGADAFSRRRLPLRVEVGPQ
jgi:hypothetical protein